jgi:hypothetical protein
VGKEGIKAEMGLSKPRRGSCQSPVFLRRVIFSVGLHFSSSPAGPRNGKKRGPYTYFDLLFFSHFNFLHFFFQMMMCQEGIGGCKRAFLQMVWT